GRRGREDDHRLQLAFASGGGRKNRGAFGAIAKAVRGVLDIASAVDFARAREDRRADPKLRIRRVGKFRGGARRFFQPAESGGAEGGGNVRSQALVSRRQRREWQTPNPRGCAPRSPACESALRPEARPGRRIRSRKRLSPACARRISATAPRRPASLAR